MLNLFSTRNHGIYAQFRGRRCPGRGVNAKKTQNYVRLALNALNLCKIYAWALFHCFEPYITKVRNMRSEKKSFLVLFKSAKSNSDHVTISNFSSFFQKINFFLLFRPPILRKWEKWSQQKNLWVLSYGAKSISVHFRNSIFFKTF